MVFHISKKGNPELCRAEKEPCRLNGAHYETFTEAYVAQLKKNETDFGLFETASKSSIKDLGEITIGCHSGDLTVKDGDLSNFKTRNALINGLCGDLALAVHRKTGGAPYFVCYGIDEEELHEGFNKDSDFMVSAVGHVLIESQVKPNSYMDAYGQKSIADLEDFYGDDIVILEGTPEMLEAFAAEGQADNFSNFADSVIALDARNESFDYYYFEDDDDFEDEL